MCPYERVPAGQHQGASLNGSQPLTPHIPNPDAGLYDVPLVPEQVQALYEAVVPGPAAPALGQFFVSPLLVTTRGQPCVMPADSQGQPLWRDCLLLRGVRACPTSSGQWAVSTADQVIQATLPR